MPEENWKNVVGFDGYEVSDLGRVRSWRRNGGGKGPLSQPRHLVADGDRDGYLKVRLQDGNGGSSKKLVHRLVLEAFVGPCPDGMEARHVTDNDPANCTLANLAWGTKAENMDDKRRHGTMPLGDNHWARRSPHLRPRGERCYQAKLTEDTVREALNSTEPSHVVAERLGVSSSTIRKVRNGRNWRQISEGAQ